MTFTKKELEVIVDNTAERLYYLKNPKNKKELESIFEKANKMLQDICFYCSKPIINEQLLMINHNTVMNPWHKKCYDKYLETGDY